MFKTILILLALLVCAPSSSYATPPRWVAAYFSGQTSTQAEHAGVAFIIIENDRPTQHEIETVEHAAKRALARQFESVVSSQMNDSLSDINGDATQEVHSRSSQKTHLQMRTNPVQLWIDSQTKQLWARVGIPKTKAKDWINEVPLKYEKAKVREIHALIVRSRNEIIWLKTEEGRKIKFTTSEDIPVRERVVVMYHGASPREIYWEGTRLDGKIIK